jgi:hypothetical protein
VDTIAEVSHPALSLVLATLAVGGSIAEAVESIRVAGMGTLEALDAILASDLDRLVKAQVTGGLATTLRRGEPSAPLLHRLEASGTSILSLALTAQDPHASRKLLDLLPEDEARFWRNRVEWDAVRNRPSLNAHSPLGHGQTAAHWIPPGTIVAGSMRLAGDVYFVAGLGDGLEVMGDADLSEAVTPRAWTIGQGTRIHGALDLSGSGIRALPADLQVGKGLDLRRCSAWDRVLPEGLDVGGEVRTDRFPDGLPLDAARKALR